MNSDNRNNNNCQNLQDTDLCHHPSDIDGNCVFTCHHRSTSENLFTFKGASSINNSLNPSDETIPFITKSNDAKLFQEVPSEDNQASANGKDLSEIVQHDSLTMCEDSERHHADTHTSKLEANKWGSSYSLSDNQTFPNYLQDLARTWRNIEEELVYLRLYTDDQRHLQCQRHRDQQETNSNIRYGPLDCGCAYPAESLLYLKLRNQANVIIARILNRLQQQLDAAEAS